MNKEKIFPVPPEAKEAFRKFAETNLGWEVRDTKISKIAVSKFSERKKDKVVTEICVGEEASTDLFDTPSEPVLAIFESNAYLVITPNRGGLRGLPYLFGHEQVLSVEREK